MTTSQHMPAVFLDRDGTLIEDRGQLRSPSEVVFYPDTIPALRRLGERFRLFIVTHQPGIATGLASADEVARVNAHVVAELNRAGIAIAAVYCCPHRREDNCDCIKPRPFFLNQAARAYSVTLPRSFVVGDHPHDVALAEQVGATGIYVLTGHGARHRATLPPGRTVLPGIREAVEWILACDDLRRREAAAPETLARAAALLRAGGIVAFPTETVYGLGAAVFDERAVARVFEAKQRPRFDPLIAHIGDMDALPLLTPAVPAIARALMERFWPGPLTLILPKTAQVPDLVTAGLPTVAIRMPRHPLALALIARAGTPIAAPSANPFGYTSPTTAAHVRAQLADRVDLILDGGPCAVGVESTILDLTAPDGPALLRPGGVTREELASVIGPLPERPAGHGPPGVVAAPGMLPRHYAPRVPLRLLEPDEPCPTPPPGRVGLLTLQPPSDAGRFAGVECLSRDGDLREAAANLFGALRRLDEQPLDLILARRVPASGLGIAINDRLTRAAAAETEP